MISQKSGVINVVIYRSMQQSARLTILETIYGLNSNTKLVKEAFEKGAVIYLLDVFCNSDVPGYR